MKTPAEAAAECDFGKPSARKSGRNPKWPYVPVIVSPTGRTTQIRMRAFATRAEAVAYSEIAAQWHPTRNGILTPADVTPRTARRVWWQCPNGHEWQATVHNRTTGTGRCGRCAGQVPTATSNLAAARPEVAAQWHPTRNGNLTPADVTTKATKQVAWICTEGHEWTTAIAGRTSADCPECTEARSELADHPLR